MIPDISKLKLHELEELQIELEGQIHKLQREAKLAKKHTKEEIIAMFSHFGYTVPKGAKIWRIRDLEHEGAYGMEVGGFEHSCHIETTDFKVLLVVDDTYHDVESYSDIWLSDPIVI